MVLQQEGKLQYGFILVVSADASALVNATCGSRSYGRGIRNNKSKR